MALISAATIITSLSLFHVTLAYFFLTSPGAIADQTLVFIIGEAMGLPNTRSFETQSPPLAFLSALLLVVGITDLVSVSLPEEVSQYFWGSQGPSVPFLFPSPSPFASSFLPFLPFRPSPNSTNNPQAPVRFLLFSLLAAYSYLFADTSPIYASKSYSPSSWGEGLKNRVLFTWAFVEMITWFWIYVTLREERTQMAIRIQARKAVEDDML